MKIYTEFPNFLKRRLLVPFILLAFSIAPIGYAKLTGYLKIPDIPGESQRVDHEDEIDIHGIAWKVHVEPAEVGSGRTSARAEFSAITVQKYYDSSSPYLFLSTAQGKAFDEITLTFNRPNSDSGEFSYLKITLTNCVVTNYEVSGEVSSDDRIAEEVSLSYETINILYTVQDDDHSAGDEHEIEYDIAAGV